MTPALQEKAMKGHGIYLSASLSSRAMESSETLAMGSARPVKEKMKDGSVGKITCSVLGVPTHQATHNTDCFNLKCFDSQSSKDYPLLMKPSLTVSVNTKNCTPRNSEEHNCAKIRNLGNSMNKHLSQIMNSESGEQIRKETLSGTAQNVPDMGRFQGLHLTESRNEEEKLLPNSKLYRKNGFLGKALFVNSETKQDLFHQVHHDTLESAVNYRPNSKKQELNFRLLQCVNKQQILLNQAKRTQKHLQILLAKHVVKHCDHQMKCFVRHQLQRMKAFHDPSNILGSNDDGCTSIKTENLNSDADGNQDMQHDICVEPGEIKAFACSTVGLLSQMEESLDSEATCSSSSEDDDDDEQVSRRAMAVNYRSDCKWLVERARVGCRWTWLQAQISELEYKIQQLTDLHKQIRATKGMVVLEEFSVSKDTLKKRKQLADQETVLNATGTSQTSLERQDAWPEHDFETSPSSPTLLLRNIEKQSAQLSEIISSLITPLTMSPTSSPLSPKSYKQKELVNGIALRDPEHNEDISSSSNWLIDQQHLKKRRKDKTKLRATTTSVMTTSARTRPLHSFQRRKLYKMSTIFSLNQQLEDRLFNTEDVHSASTWNIYELSLKSKTQKQFMLEVDASFHPVVSFPSDTPLHVHFRRLLKKCEIKGDPFETSALGFEFKMSPSNEYFQYKTPLQQWNCGYDSSSRYHTLSEISEQMPEGRKKRHLSETVTGQSRNRFEGFSFQHEEQQSHNNFTGSVIGDMLSRSSHITSSQFNSRRRLRSESSYDIDNIVIPMSLVAPSKLEKLQYKEILTPSWRTITLKPLRCLQEDEEQAEDLSDDVYAVRHAKYEVKERARWSLWEQCHWPKRNRSYSRNFEGQDPALKENQVNSNLTPNFSENSTDNTSEISNYFYSRIPQSSEGNQETTAVLWAHRTFPLNDKEAEALICQPLIMAVQESSNVDILSDSHCNSHSAFSFPNYKQPQKKEEHAQYLENGSLRKQT
ncbi:KAT8 regulatory NSL complex subunit 1-like protein [Anolis carolinensis]|uniref:KAT8 regulatory NSL complex subunit 1-like protein n=1 Tax=Anolis carolinensis TaxID=28377 RepID=UPI002F2B6701